MEQLDYNLLFRWFVGLGVDDPVWDVTVFTKNRDRAAGWSFFALTRTSGRAIRTILQTGTAARLPLRKRMNS